MINNLNDFNKALGEIMMYSQFIEHDIKEIYANILGGPSDINFENIKMMTLGETLINLEELDIRRKMGIMSLEEYLDLKTITKIRNFWAHNAYASFAYSSNEEDFLNTAKKLEKDLNKLINLQADIEEKKIRISGRK